MFGLMNDPWAQVQSPSVTVEVNRPDWLTDDVKLALDMYHFPYNRDGVLMLHQKMKENLDFYKEREMDYRKLAAKLLVPGDPVKNEGMNNVELGNGFVAKVGIKLNYTLGDDNKRVFAMQDAVAKIGNNGPFISERLISWTPKFLVTEYRTLQEEAEGGSVEAKQMLDEINKVLVITDGAPTLEIREPKKKKGQ